MSVNVKVFTEFDARAFINHLKMHSTDQILVVRQDMVEIYEKFDSKYDSEIQKMHAAWNSVFMEKALPIASMYHMIASEGME